MKLLTKLSSRTEVEKLKYLFESSGIAVKTSNEHSASMFGNLTATQFYTIWVVFEEQFDDAKHLLEDKTYEVKNPINMQDYLDSIEQNAGQHTLNVQAKVIKIGLIFIASFFLLMFFLHLTT